MGSRRTMQDRAEEKARDQRLVARFMPRSADTADPAAAADGVPPKDRHCWVRQDDRAVQALLICWTRGPGGWWAEVVLVDRGEVRTLTVPASDVRPARGEA